MNNFFITTLFTFFVLSFSSAVFANVTEDLVGKNVKVFFNDGKSCVFSIHEDSKVSADCMPDVPVKYRIVEGKKIKFIMWGPYTTNSGLSKSVTIYYNTSSNFMIASLLDEKDAKWETLDIKDVEISEIADNDITPNENEILSNENTNNIFFKVVSKEKFIDENNEEACLTKFEVINKSKYVLFNDYSEAISSFIMNINSESDNSGPYGMEILDLINPNLKKTDPDLFEDKIEYFNVDMEANLGGYYSSFDYGEHSSIVSFKKCKSIKKYIIKLQCETYTADWILDSNENEIQWKSDKEAYRTILNLLAPHPEHDNKKYGKFEFKRPNFC